MGKTFSTGLLTDGIAQDSSNNIGIGGAANASYKLAVTGASLFTGAATFSSNIAIAGNTLSAWGSTFGVMQSYYGSYFGGTSGGATVMGNNNYFDGTNYKYINSDYAGQIQIGGGNLLFRVAPSGTAGNNVTFTNALTITSTGNVGIGTSSPSQLLTVAGATSLAWVSAVSRLSIDRSGAVARLQNYDGGSAANIALAWDGGNVGIATTSPAALLTLKGRGGADIIFQMNDESNIRRCFYIPNQYYGYMWAVGVVSNGGKAFSFGNENGSEVGTIVINSSSVAYNTTSDYRLKEDLKDFDGLSILSKVKFYDFKWKSEDTRTTGVIAHELQEVVPYAVNGEKDAIGKDDNPSYQGVDYSKLVAIMGKSIQELSAKVTALENKG